MLQVIIIGARAFGGEVFHLSRRCIGYGTEWQIKGFLDEKQTPIGELAPIISSVEDYTVQENDRFVCALGDVKFKKKYIEIIKQKGGKFLNLISKNAILDSDISSAEGIIVADYCTISTNVIIKDFVTVNGFNTLGHDCEVGPYCQLGAYAFLGGHSKLGENVQFHPKSTVIPRIKIGDNVVVGAGSVVFRNVPDNVTVLGNPATVLKF